MNLHLPSPSPSPPLIPQSVVHSEWSSALKSVSFLNNLFGTIANYVEKLKNYTYTDQTKTQPTGIPPAVAVPSGPPSSNSNSQQYHTVPEINDDSSKKPKVIQPSAEDDGTYINCAEMSPEELKKHLGEKK